MKEAAPLGGAASFSRSLAGSIRPLPCPPRTAAGFLAPSERRLAGRGGNRRRDGQTLVMSRPKQILLYLLSLVFCFGGFNHLLNPQFYVAIMHGKSPLTRFQRELVATAVSAELDCHY